MPAEKKKEKESNFNIKYVIIGVLCTLLTIGIVDHFKNIDPNGCEMTYMWETPEYIPVDTPADLSAAFPRFRLYSYGEGAGAARLRAGAYRGLPVLFVPGNGGSHKQVRSLASVAYRTALEDGQTKAFDFFTVDLAGDLPALYGPALREHTDYVSAVIPVIQRLYGPHTSVVLMGHSMGGLVARAAVLAPHLTPAVPLILTLATPHHMPPLSLDPHMHAFYEKTNGAWTLQRAALLANTTLVTVAGGRNDVQVAPLAARSAVADVNAGATGVPHCWVSADHQSIAWCRQLVLAVTRALYDSVRKTHYLPRPRLAQVWDYHLVSRHAGKRYVSKALSSSKKQTKLAPEAVYSVRATHRDTVTHSKGQPNTVVMLPLTGDDGATEQPSVARLVLCGAGAPPVWLTACTAVAGSDGPSCPHATSLVEYSVPLSGACRTALVPLRQLEHAGYTHLALPLPPAPLTLTWDLHHPPTRRLLVSPPRLYQSLGGPTQVLARTQAKTAALSLLFEGLNEPWMSYLVYLTPVGGQCSSPRPSAAPAPETRHQAAPLPPALPSMWLHQHTSPAVYRARQWREDETFVFRIEQDEVAVLKGESAEAEATRGDLAADVFLAPTCDYRVAVKADLPGAFRRVFALYGPQLPAFVAVQLLLALALQLKGVAAARYAAPSHAALLALTPMLVVPFASISDMLLKKLGVATDLQEINESGYAVGMMPMFLFMASLPVSLLLSCAVSCLLLLTGTAINSFLVKVLKRSYNLSNFAADACMSGLSTVPAVVALGLMALACVTCGDLALVAAAAFYMTLVFDMFAAYLRKVALGLVPAMATETVPDPPPPASPFGAPAAPADQEAAGDTTTDATEAGAASTDSSEAVAATVDNTSAPVVPQSSESLSLQLHTSLLLLLLLAAALQLPSLLAWAAGRQAGADGVLAAVQGLAAGSVGAPLAADPSLLPSLAILACMAFIWQRRSACHDRQHYQVAGQLVHGVAVACVLFGSLRCHRVVWGVAAAMAVMAVHLVAAPAAPTTKDKEE